MRERRVKYHSNFMCRTVEVKSKTSIIFSLSHWHLAPALPIINYMKKCYTYINIYIYIRT